MRKGERKERKVFQNVEIIDTADDGLAIGRCEDGRIIMVRHAVPGDRVDAVAVEKRKGMYFTKATSYITLSNYRTEPFCSHFGTCGGCKWQHMSYEAQLHFKEKTVLDAFHRIGGLDKDLIQPIVGSRLQQYYRNKLEFTASDTRWLTTEEMQHRDEIAQKDGIGFHLPGAFDKVLDIQHCYLQADPSNDIRLFVKKICEENNWPFFNLRSKEGFLRNLVLRNNLIGEWMCVLVVGVPNQEWITILVNAIKKEFPQIKSLHSCINTKVNDSIHDLSVQLEFGQPTIIETLGHVQFHIGPKSFFQTNSTQAENLYSLAKKMAGLQPSENVYDLYCGVGSLGIYMADSCKKVVGIEIIAEAIEDAKENAKLNGINNIHFAVGKVELMLDPSFVAQHGKPDVVITDPPRAGMHPDVITHLLRAEPNRIVYVSCNPATQARDIKMMSEKYELQSAIPVDMFPHTHHIESIALLNKK